MPTKKKREKITDNLEEEFAVVNEDDVVIGQTTRTEAHQNPFLLHRSVGVVIFNRKGEIFLQQRSRSKDTEPLKWTISCSGHVGIQSEEEKEKGRNLKGRQAIYEAAAHRELKEELGVDLEIKPFGKYLCQTPWESELMMLFRAEAEGPFQLNKEEIFQGKFFTRKELNEALKKGKIKLSFSGRMALEKIGWL